MDLSYELKITNCNDCGAKPGKRHKEGCDVARCTACGGQDISCDCDEPSKKPKMQVWTGIWPGVLECFEYGWFSKFKPGQGGWIECDINDPDGVPDLNKINVYAKWDADKQRYVKRA
jgi:hypothetical protein